MKRVVLLASFMTFAAAGVLVVAQQTSVVPQPRAVWRLVLSQGCVGVAVFPDQ